MERLIDKMSKEEHSVFLVCSDVVICLSVILLLSEATTDFLVPLDIRTDIVYHISHFSSEPKSNTDSVEYSFTLSVLIPRVFNRLDRTIPSVCTANRNQASSHLPTSDPPQRLRRPNVHGFSPGHQQRCIPSHAFCPFTGGTGAVICAGESFYWFRWPKQMANE